MNDTVYVSVFLPTFLGWFTAQFLKFIFTLIGKRKLDFRRLLGSGGMPSSHSASVMALAVAVGLREGFATSIFAIAMCLALIVMTDAAGVRRAAGKQAAMLNRMADELRQGQGVTYEELKELIGHTPFEVFAGAILGASIAVISHAMQGGFN